MHECMMMLDHVHYIERRWGDVDTVVIVMCRCCVQRIAKRSGMLSEDRIALMDAIGFDWTGADALS